MSSRSERAASAETCSREFTSARPPGQVEAVDEGTVGKILIAEGTDAVKVNEVIAVLLEEGETIISRDHAVHQDIRELHIGLLNMMPDKALSATERQFFRLAQPLAGRRKRLRRQLRRKARPEHYPAPFALLELWERFGANGTAAYRAEAESIYRASLEERNGEIDPTARTPIRFSLLP